MIVPHTPLGTVRALVTGGLVAFFVVGAMGNMFPPETVRGDYARWGYPGWFHYLTGTAELLTAALLARPNTRRLGRMVGAAVMLAATGTLLAFLEIGHIAAPAVVLAHLGLSEYLDEKAREARWEGRRF